MRDDFPRGKFHVHIDDSEFSLRDYHAFAASIRTESDAFKARQQAAFEAERERWAEYTYEPAPIADAANDEAVPDGCQAVRSPVTANIWKLNIERGQRVDAGQKVIVVEAMKMEIVVSSPADGEIVEIRCTEGALVTGGQILAVLRPKEAA
jgi:urea carboxylase